jgi:hypothetical protein
MIACQKINKPRFTRLGVSVDAATCLWAGVAHLDGGGQLHTTPVGSEGAAWFHLARAILPPPTPALDVEIDLRTMTLRDVPAVPGPTQPWDEHLRRAGQLIDCLQAHELPADTQAVDAVICSPTTSTAERRRLVERQFAKLGDAIAAQRYVGAQVAKLTRDPMATALRRTELWLLLQADRLQFHRQIVGRCAVLRPADMQLVAHRQPTGKVDRLLIRGGPDDFADVAAWAAQRAVDWLADPTCLAVLRAVVGEIEAATAAPASGAGDSPAG